MSAPTALTQLQVGGVPIWGNSPVPFACRQPIVGGRVYFVGPNALGLPGAQPNTNFTTLLAAVAALGSRANQGDVIYVMPGHTESISSADYFVNATNNATGYSIIGLGVGTLRPQFTWTTATSTWLMANAGVEIVNCQLFLAGPSATGALTVAAPMTISAANCRIIGCYIQWGWDADSIVGTGIAITATDCEFSYNTCFAAVAGVPSTAFLTFNAATRLKMYWNNVDGPGASASLPPVQGVTALTTVFDFAYNEFRNTIASSTKALLLFNGANTGSIRYNTFFLLAGTGNLLPVANPAVAGSLVDFHQNYVVNTTGQTGALVGTAST